MLSRFASFDKIIATHNPTPIISSFPEPIPFVNEFSLDSPRHSASHLQRTYDPDASTAYNLPAIETEMVQQGSSDSTWTREGWERQQADWNAERRMATTLRQGNRDRNSGDVLKT